jgi:hypothetical protein
LEKLPAPDAKWLCLNSNTWSTRFKGLDCRETGSRCFPDLSRNTYTCQVVINFDFIRPCVTYSDSQMETVVFIALVWSTWHLSVQVSTEHWWSYVLWHLWHLLRTVLEISFDDGNESGLLGSQWFVSCNLISRDDEHVVSCLNVSFWDSCVEDVISIMFACLPPFLQKFLASPFSLISSRAQYTWTQAFNFQSWFASDGRLKLPRSSHRRASWLTSSRGTRIRSNGAYLPPSVTCFRSLLSFQGYQPYRIIYRICLSYLLIIGVIHPRVSVLCPMTNPMQLHLIQIQL